MNQNLDYYKKDITSQWGEDGIIEELFHRLGDGNKFCIEFGAWDGKNYSNTWNLWHEKGWGALLIEGDPKKYKDLKISCESFLKVTPHCAYVESQGEKSLDKILSREAPKKEIDLLCIDIDGDDYYIFESLQIKPRVIIIEYNPTIPPQISMVQKPGEYFGASAKALVNLAHLKGYELIALTDTNCIFVKKELFQNLKIPYQKLSDIFTDSHLTYIITSFDGITFANRMPPYGVIKQIEYTRLKYLKQLPKPCGDHVLKPVILKTPDLLIEKLTRKTVRKIKKLLKKTFVHTVYLYFKMKQSSFRQRIVHKVKERAILFYKKKFNLTTLVETGTYQGEMVRAMINNFEQIYSIELSDFLCEKAKEKFKETKKIKILCGDSGELLCEILTKIDKPCLFWLDAHYSSGETAKGNLETPIIKELKTILNRYNSGSVIIIDDARLFDGTNGYPKLSILRDFIFKQNKNLNIEIFDDMIRIYPK